jgi:hypothetical protein
VNTGNNLAFRTAFNRPSPDYRSFRDFDGSGIINIGDNFDFRNRFNKALTWRLQCVSFSSSAVSSEWRPDASK